MRKGKQISDEELLSVMAQCKREKLTIMDACEKLDCTRFTLGNRIEALRRKLRHASTKGEGAVKEGANEALKAIKNCFTRANKVKPDHYASVVASVLQAFGKADPQEPVQP